MKKINLFVIALTTITSLSIAQDGDNTDKTDFRDNLSLGFKAGANYSNVYDSQGEQFNADPKVGLAAGIFLAIPIGTYLGVQPELLFSQKGFQATGNFIGSEYKLTRTTSFIDLPIFFALKPSEFITVLVGPQYSYLVNQKDVFTSSIASYEQEKEFANDNIRKNIFGIAGGLDITLKHIVFGARAAWDVQNNNGDGTSTTPRYKNVLYQGTFGFRF